MGKVTVFSEFYIKMTLCEFVSSYFRSARMRQVAKYILIRKNPHYLYAYKHLIIYISLFTSKINFGVHICRPGQLCWLVWYVFFRHCCTRADVPCPRNLYKLASFTQFEQNDFTTDNNYLFQHLLLGDPRTVLHFLAFASCAARQVWRIFEKSIFCYKMLSFISPLGEKQWVSGS